MQHDLLLKLPYMHQFTMFVKLKRHFKVSNPNPTRKTLTAECGQFDKHCELTMYISLSKRLIAYLV